MRVETVTKRCLEYMIKAIVMALIVLWGIYMALFCGMVLVLKIAEMFAP